MTAPNAPSRGSLLDGLDMTSGPRPAGPARKDGPGRKIVLAVGLAAAGALGFTAWRISHGNELNTVDPEVQQQFDQIKQSATRESPEIPPPDPPADPSTPEPRAVPRGGSRSPDGK